MGLRNKEAKKEFEKYLRRKEFLEFLAEFGLTEEMLRKLPTLFEEKKPETRTVPTDDEKKEFQKKYTNVPTMEQIVEQFTGDVEEFYPNGRPKKQPTRNNS